MNLNTLCEDVLYEVFRLCDLQSIYNLSLTSENMSCITKEERLWKDLLCDISDGNDYFKLLSCNTYYLTMKKYCELLTLKIKFDMLESVIDIYNITRLNLSNKQLVTLPSELGHLSSLKYLDLDNNELVTLPSELGHLSSLERLYLNNNELVT